MPSSWKRWAVYRRCWIQGDLVLGSANNGHGREVLMVQLVLVLGERVLCGEVGRERVDGHGRGGGGCGSGVGLLAGDHVLADGSCGRRVLGVFHDGVGSARGL